MAFACFGAAALAAEEPIVLPSGANVTFHDVIWGEPGPAGLTIRFRFLDPELGARENADGVIDATDDTTFLCETFALERIATTGPQPNQVIISISDRPVEFGTPDPEATQIFEAFSYDGETCIWEMY
ncbi:acetolactate synthase [Maritimibacter sp. DP1N21-5]|nr:acetolactate synthase [Maritimibacter sp. DP1N21-5]